DQGTSPARNRLQVMRRAGFDLGDVIVRAAKGLLPLAQLIEILNEAAADEAIAHAERRAELHCARVQISGHPDVAELEPDRGEVDVAANDIGRRTKLLGQPNAGLD